jgi:hypothetical protein
MPTRILLRLLIIVILFLNGTIIVAQTPCSDGGLFIVAEIPPSSEISNSQLEELLNTSINLNNLSIPNGHTTRIMFTINCKGEDFGYFVLNSQTIDSTFMERLFLVVHSNVHWTPAKQGHYYVDFRGDVTLKIENGKFIILDINGNIKVKKRRNN